MTIPYSYFTVPVKPFLQTYKKQTNRDGTRLMLLFLIDAHQTWTKNTLTWCLEYTLAILVVALWTVMSVQALNIYYILCTDIHGPQRIKTNNFRDILSFHLQQLVTYFYSYMDWKTPKNIWGPSWCILMTFSETSQCPLKVFPWNWMQTFMFLSGWSGTMLFA